jgi:hypothetical protein
MKSFSQFLKEEEARQGRLLNRKNQAYKDINNPNPGNRGYATDLTPTPASKRLSPGAPEAPKSSPGQLEIPEPKTTKVSGQRVRSAGEMRQPSLITKSGGAQDFTKAGKGKVPFTSSEPVKATKRLPETPTTAPKTSPGQMEIDFNAKPSSSKPPSSSTTTWRPGGENVKRTFPKPASTPSTPPSSSTTTWRPGGENVKRTFPKPASTPSTPSTPSPSGGKSSTPSPSKEKLPAGAKPTGKFGKALKVLGPAATALDVGLSTADERAKGSGWGRSLAKGAAVAAGGLAGGALGAIGGGGIGSAALGAGGAVLGSQAAGKAFDTVAGANAVQRKAIATANRQAQSGSALKGIGGKTTFDTKKGTMTTGSGSQQKTVKLGKTSVVTGPGGKQDVGYLAYKGGKAVYKRADTKNLAQTSSNPLERIGRSLFAGAYKKSDAAAAAKKLAQARQSDVARNKALGVKALPGK